MLWFKPKFRSTEEINAILDSEFEGPWYLGFIDGDDFIGVSDFDTMAHHPSWKEWVYYPGPYRPRAFFYPAKNGEKVLSNLDFSIHALTAGKIVGIFLTSSWKKNGADGEIKPRSITLLEEPSVIRTGHKIIPHYSFKSNKVTQQHRTKEGETHALRND